jgi:hypothetical protein
MEHCEAELEAIEEEENHEVYGKSSFDEMMRIKGEIGFSIILKLQQQIQQL